MKIGCHLSSSGGYLAMAQTAVSIGANVFQFFTRNPRGGAAKPIDRADVAAFRDYAAAQGVGPILAHAPYTLNAAGAEARVRDFAAHVFVDDLKRLEATPGALYNFHPGSHVGQGAEAGVALVADLLRRVCAAAPDGGWKTTILLETMAGKGTELGRTFEEIRALIDAAESQIPQTPKHPNNQTSAPLFGVCLDTCHVWDGGYDIVGDLDGVLDEFDRVIGLERLKAIHANDSMNGRDSHKDRHAKIGKGKIGLEAFRRIVNHPKLRDLPFYLETPCDLQEYRDEIALMKSLGQPQP